MRQGPSWATWRLVPLLIALAVIIVTDLYLRIIPNKITVPSIAYALAIAALSGKSALGHAVLGAAVAGATILLLAIVSRGGIGGGDLKLMVIVGAALGWQTALLVFALSQIVALGAALVVSVAQRRILRGWLPIGAIISALAAAVLVTNPQ
jgi:Flp pilus assembly protein protease CpaA